MTYTGKPSSACRTCRQRRIKCDEGRPSCAQCKKTRRECLGYPDPSDLIFQNQTKAVIRRAKRIHDGTAKRASAASSVSSGSPASTTVSQDLKAGPATDVSNWMEPSPPHVSPCSFQSPLDVAVTLIIPNPAIPIETRALEFFMTAQLLEPMSHGRVVGHLTFLPPLFSNSLSTSALAKVTTAASLASFDLVGSSNTRFQQSAYSSYGEAVVALARAMSDDRERVRNETLLACILMVAVESMLAKESSPHKQWAAHVGGAGQLLCQRGRIQVSKDPVARRLWSVVKAFLAQNPANRLYEDEVFAFDLPSDGLSVGSPPPETSLGMLAIAVTNLTARSLDILTNYAHQNEQLKVLVDDCQILDHELCTWALNLPQSYQYVSVQMTSGQHFSADDIVTLGATPSSRSDAPDTEHHYHDPHLQRLWNSYRVARITLNALIYRASTASACLMPNATDLHTTCSQTMHSLANDILVSVPQTLLDSRTILPRNVVSAAGEIALFYYCLWPLYIARGVAILPSSTKQRIVDTMARIIDKYGFRHGRVLLDIAIRHDSRPLWGGPWQEGWVETNWQWAFMYGCGAL